jgi:tyrosyl-DNA phosphodiesterase-1
MFLLGLSNGTLRVIIHTANLLEGDQHVKAQGAYIQDFPLKATNSATAASGDFENDLVDYTKTYGYEKQKRWGQRGDRTTLCDELKRYDFSSAKAVLIASTPGYHSVKNPPLRGYLKLSKAIQDHCPLSSSSSQPIVCQFSSIGALSPKWLTAFVSALNAAQQPCTNLESSVKLVFPTAEEIRSSLEGYAGGGSVPSNSKNVDKAFLQPLYHKWSSSSSSSSSIHKSHNVPHIKTFYQLGNDSRSMQWFCLTSHNLSTAAWGQVQNNKWGGQSFFIRHWELGVFLAPSMFGNDARMGPVPEGRALVEDTTKVVGIPLPYPVNPTKYDGENDEVFSWDRTYTRRDRFGLYGTMEG